MHMIVPLDARPTFSNSRIVSFRANLRNLGNNQPVLVEFVEGKKVHSRKEHPYLPSIASDINLIGLLSIRGVP